jgi:hypothetical protein
LPFETIAFRDEFQGDFSAVLGGRHNAYTWILAKKEPGAFNKTPIGVQIFT